MISSAFSTSTQRHLFASRASRSTEHSPYKLSTTCLRRNGLAWSQQRKWTYLPRKGSQNKKQRPVLLLMSGADLMAVFEGRIDFVDLLVRKRRHASQTGRILIEFSQM